MSNGSEPPPPPVPLGIGGQWIKANVIGAILNLVLTFVAFSLGRLLGVSDPGTSGVFQSIYMAFATAMFTLGMVLFGYLTGVVLRTKLPAFPMRVWLTLYLVIGVIAGLVSSFSWIEADITPSEGPYEVELVTGLLVGAALAGGLAGLLLGSVQALVLRVAAQGLGLWIACCTLSGMLFVMVIPAVLYGPQGGVFSELTIQAVTLAVTILAAVVLLPAVRRLRPR